MFLIFIIWFLRIIFTPTFLVILLLYLWHAEVEKDLTSTQRKRLPPGNYGLPFLGETLSFVKSGRILSRQKIRKYGSIYKTHLMGSPTIRVSGCDAVKELLSYERECLLPQWPTSVTQMIGPHSLISSHGALHQQRRAALHKAFVPESLNFYLPICQSLVNQEISHWCESDSIKVYEKCKNLTFLLSAATLLNLHFSQSQCQNLLASFTKMEKNLFTIAMRLPWPLNGFTEGMNAREEIRRQLKEILQEQQSKNEEEEENDQKAADGTRRRSGGLLLTSLQDQTVWQNTDEFIDCIIELLFAGHETTTSSLTTLIGLLASNDKVVDKILAEDKEYSLLAANQQQPSGCDDYKSLNSRPYLSAVVKEALRLHPPVGAVYRKVVKSFTLQNYFIPAGWSIAYSIRDTIESSPLFADQPDEFLPERWELLDMAKTSKHYFPFGIGGRLCLGRQFALMVLHVTVLELVRNFQWNLLAGPLRYGNGLLLRPIDGLPAHFIHRENKQTATTLTKTS